MPFQSIWDVGGFVFSNMLNHIIEEKEIDRSLLPNGKDSFFITREKYGEINPAFKYKNDTKDNFLFVSNCQTFNNSILKKYNFKENTRPYFISRFYPTDYFSILSTLYILQDFDFNFTKYILSVSNSSSNDIIRRIHFILYLLSYHGIGQKKLINIQEFSVLKKEALYRKKSVLKIIENSKLFEKEYLYFISSDAIFNQKRSWCSLRDYCKSSFKTEFLKSLRSTDKKSVNLLFDNKDQIRKDLLKQFELPGDVWNNNDRFINCVFPDAIKNRKSKKFNMILREIFEVNKVKTGYPEQFDITFDFVPRMCEQPDNCKICPYGLLNNIESQFGELCISDRTKFCPVVYVSCNYSVMCKGSKCSLFKLYKRL